MQISLHSSKFHHTLHLVLGNPIVSTYSPNDTMPLVLPNQDPNQTSKTEEWQNKLVGKTVNDTASNETVSATSQLHHCLHYIDSVLTIVELLQARAAPANPHHYARQHGHQGFQRESPQCPRRKGWCRHARVPRLSFGGEEAHDGSRTTLGNWLSHRQVNRTSNTTPKQYIPP